MNHSRKILSTLVLSLVLMACAGAKYEAGDKANDPGAQKTDPDYGRAACEIEYFDQSLSLDLWNYEFVSSNGGKFGFSNLGIIGLLDFSFQVDKATLQMKVYPASPYELQKDYSVSSNDKDVRFGVEVGFGNIAVGFDHYSKTPVAALTKDALMKSLSELKNRLNKQEWSTRVLRSPVDHRDQVIIQAGTDAGIAPGDEFEVYDIKHHWDPETAPCASTYVNYELSPKIATLTVAGFPGRKRATLKIKDERISNVEIPPGSYIRQVPKSKKQLGRSIKLNQVVSGVLQLKDGNKIDLIKYVKMQFTDALQDKKWKGLFYSYDQ